MSQSDFSAKVNGQTKIKKEANRWTKEPAQEQRHTIPLLTSQGGIKWHAHRVINKSKRHG